MRETVGRNFSQTVLSRAVNLGGCGGDGFLVHPSADTGRHRLNPCFEDRRIQRRHLNIVPLMPVLDALLEQYSLLVKQFLHFLIDSPPLAVRWDESPHSLAVSLAQDAIANHRQYEARGWQSPDGPAVGKGYLIHKEPFYLKYFG